VLSLKLLETASPVLCISAIWRTAVALAQVVLFKTASLGLVSLLATNAFAQTIRSQPHNHRITYRLNPYIQYVWSQPRVTFMIGNWGADPQYYPYAHMWSHSGNPHDMACNMPSSPCWDQDRE
jgi:hypothetical protein